MSEVSFHTVDDWAAWLRSLDPIEAIKVGTLLASGATIRRLASVVDEIIYCQTKAGGGEMTQAELAETIGSSKAAIARRAGRHLKECRSSVWKAVLAPVGLHGSTRQIIDTGCRVKVSAHASLLNTEGRRLGRITDAAVVGGYLVASGSLLIGERIPGGQPTFDVNGEPTISDDPPEFRFRDLTITTIRSGFVSCWDDPTIAFS